MAIHQTTDTYRSDVAWSNLSDSFQLKNAASGSASISVLLIAMNVMFVRPRTRTDDSPAMMNIVARVTMNDGNPVRTTMSPLRTPRPVVRTMEMRIDNQIGRPQ